MERRGAGARAPPAPSPDDASRARAPRAPARGAWRSARGAALAAALALAALACGARAWALMRAHAARAAGAAAGACAAWAAAHDARAGGGAALAAGARALAAARASGAGAAGAPFFHLVAFVPSGAASAARRAALRRQFARSAALAAPAGLRARLFFVVGEAAAALVADEARAEGDVLLVACPDADGDAEPAAASATTCKLVKALRYAAARLDFLYFARVGDDAFFRVDAFLSRVAAAHWADGAGGAGAAALVGRVIPGGGALPAHLRAAYGARAFAAYPSGMGYVFGHALARALADADARVGLVDGYPEDGVVGLWLSGLRAPLVDSPCFHDTALLPDAHERDWSNLRSPLFGWSPRPPWQPPPRRFNAAPCSPDSLLVHYMTPALWAAVDERGELGACGAMM